MRSGKTKKDGEVIVIAFPQSLTRRQSRNLAGQDSRFRCRQRIAKNNEAQ
jgi:hypothetical protein